MGPWWGFIGEHWEDLGGSRVVGGHIEEFGVEVGGFMVRFGVLGGGLGALWGLWGGGGEGDGSVGSF